MDIHFGARILALLGVAAVFSGIDFYRNGKQATAYREYGLIFLTGMLGSIVGGINDAITSSISPEYFTFGKGLEPGSNLRSEAVRYGIQVGFSGGGVSGAILVFLSRYKSNRLPAPFSYLLGSLWIPVAGAILGALILPPIASRFDPFDVTSMARPVITTNRIPDFLHVWWIHFGIYAGLFLGLCIVLALVHRQRAALTMNNAPYK